MKISCQFPASCPRIPFPVIFKFIAELPDERIMRDSNLVARTFKLRFGLKLCLFIIAGGLGVTLLLYLVTARHLGSSYGQAIYTIHDLKVRIFPLIFASSYSIFILALVTGAIAVISVLFSHKIAGPIYRIGKSLQLIGEGDFTVDTRFRGNDQLSALADGINEMVRSLNHTSRRFTDALDTVKIHEERLRELLKETDPPETDVKKGIEGLRAGVEELKATASSIRLKERY